jgi:hypothetical protein
VGRLLDGPFGPFRWMITCISCLDRCFLHQRNKMKRRVNKMFNATNSFRLMQKTTPNQSVITYVLALLQYVTERSNILKLKLILRWGFLMVKHTFKIKRTSRIWLIFFFSVHKRKVPHSKIFYQNCEFIYN